MGTVAAQQFGSFYNLLCEADLSKSDAAILNDRQKQSRPVKNSNGRSSRTATKAEAINPASAEDSGESAVDTSPVASSLQSGPLQGTSISRNGLTLHIDLQIHISPESSEAQIDTIFSSIAKYIYDRS